jgi:hypothetical protein
MARAVAALAAACLASATGAAAAPSPLQGSATIAASSARHGAKPVALTYRLTYEMQCGNPGKGPLTLSFPSQMSLPAVVPAADVLLDGKRAPSVGRSGRSLVVSLPPPPAVMCDVIGPGTLTVVITKAAGLGNPRAAGRYAFPVRSAKLSAAPKLVIS